MTTQGPTFEEVLSLVKQLTPGQKLRLIEAIVPDLEEPLQRAQEGEKPLRSLYGLGNIPGVEILLASKVLTETVIASLHAKQAGVL